MMLLRRSVVSMSLAFQYWPLWSILLKYKYSCYDSSEDPSDRRRASISSAPFFSTMNTFVLFVTVAMSLTQVSSSPAPSAGIPSVADTPAAAIRRGNEVCG